jgi:membrane associated rhomboid family serine protease
MLRLTPVVKNLIMVNVVVFFGQSILPNLTDILSLYNVHTSMFKPYQLFTYMFAHGGFFHIFFNMMMLAFLGPIIETFWGSQRFLLFYLITGIGAAVFNIGMGFIWPQAAFGAMIGASGAVYGVLTAFGVLFPNMELHLLFPPIPIKAKYLVFILGIIAIFSGFSGRAGDNVAHFAHLGGIVVALVLIRVWRSKGGMYR